MMKRARIFLPMIGVVLLLHSCKKNEEKIDTPSITSYQTAEVAYMGDSIPLAITAAGEYPLSSIKVSFYRDDAKISERLIPVNEGGTYGAKLLVPFVKDIADGNAEIQLMIKNKNFNYSIVTVPVQITRPKFPYLTLKTAYGDYRMEPVPGEPYKYAVTHAFPSTKLNALIEAPAYGENGNRFYFGGKTIVANATDQDSIPFQIIGAPGTSYTVSFDTRSFEGTPFLKPAFGDIEFPAFEANSAVIEHDFTQNQSIIIDGFTDIATWWIDPSFLDKNSDGSYKFRAASGKYRVKADQNLKYFKIEPMNGNGLADFNTATKTGGVYINGGIGDQGGSAPAERLGIPSMTGNPTLWNAEKNIAMAPLGNGIYQIKLIAGTTLFLSNVSGSTAGISFYQNSRSLSNPFSLVLTQTLYGSPGSPSASAGSARFELKAATSSSIGQIIATGSNRSLGNGRTYVFTLDTKVSPASLVIDIE